MKNTITKKLFSLLLCCLMLVGLLPLGQMAYAADVPSLSATITLPVAGEAPNERGYPGDPVKYGIFVVLFYDGDEYLVESIGDVFEAGKTYRVEIRISAHEGYTITADTVTINGSYTATYVGEASYPKNTKKYSFIYTVPETTYHEVTFDANGHGAAPVSQTVERGKTVTKPTDPTASGWRFDGWYKEAACTTKFDFSTAITGDITLYAKWTQLHKVTFDANGHGTAPAAQTVENGKTATKPTDPTASGWKFGGWYREAACTNAFDFSTPITDNITLYAKWDMITYTVTFDMQGHGTAPATQHVADGGYAARPSPDPSAEGWTFGGWYQEAACANVFYFASRAIREDTIVYAKWTGKHKVTFDVQGHGTAPATQYVDDGGHATVPPNPSAEGWSFRGWFRDAACKYEFDFYNWAITHDTTIYAKWEEKTETYLVSYDNGGGSGSVPLYGARPDSPHMLRPADTFSPPAGKEFDQWEVTIGTADAQRMDPGEIISITAATTIKALWKDKAVTYTVTISSPIEHGRVIANKTSGLSEGDLVSLTIVPETGYVLDELIVRDEGTNLVPMETMTDFRMPAANVNVSATFKEETATPVEYNIHINPMTNGSVTSDKDKAAEGEPVKLTVSPDPGYELETLHVTYGMGAEVTLDSDHGFTMTNADVVVNATFKKKALYSITVIGGGKAYSNAGKTNVITEAAEGDNIFVGYDEPAAGKYVSDVKFEGSTLDIFEWDGGLSMPAHDATFEIVTAERMTYTVDLTSGSASIPDDVYVYNQPWGSSGFPLPTGTKDIDLDGSGKNDITVTWNIGDATAAAVTHADCNITESYTVNVSASNTPYKAVIYKFNHGGLSAHTVTFDANGHGTAPAAQTVEDGKTAARPADPTASGWTFGGWYTEAACTNAFDFSTAITGDITLYAKWTEDSILPGTYTVKFDANGHGTAPDLQEIENGKTATRPADPTASGWTFGGWYTEAACTNAFDFSTAITGDITLYAKWTKGAGDPVPATKYTITYVLNGGTLDSKTGTVTVSVEDGATITLPKPTRSGYTLDYWDGSRYEAGASYKVTGDHTFTAQWKANPTGTDGKDTSPKTGDNRHTGLWIALMAASLIGLGGATVYGKGRKRRKSR